MKTRKLAFALTLGAIVAACSAAQNKQAAQIGLTGTQLFCLGESAITDEAALAAFCKVDAILVPALRPLLAKAPKKLTPCMAEADGGK